MRPYKLRTDGAARGNPGPAGIGVVLEGPDGRVIEEVARGIGWATNNVAEYEALIEGLRLALDRGVRPLKVLADSLLVVQQMRGAFRVRNAGLRPLHSRACELVRRLGHVSFEAVPRLENARADRLANTGIDAWIDEHPDFRPPGEIQPRLL